MYFHEELSKQVLLNYTDLKKIVYDMSACEGVLGEMREPHLCPKPGACDREAEMTVTKIEPARDRMQVHDPTKNFKGWAKLVPGMAVGDKITLGRHGDRPYDRLGMGEMHGFSTACDFGPEEEGGRPRVEIFAGSANRWRKFTEDAGGHCKDGRGITWYRYVFANAEQGYECAKYIYPIVKRKNKRIVFGSFPIECLFELEEDGKKIFKSFYTLENLEKKQEYGDSYFDRLDGWIKGWKEVYRPE
jgi:hypothetical protein